MTACDGCINNCIHRTKCTGYVKCSEVTDTVIMSLYEKDFVMDDDEFIGYTCDHFFKIIHFTVLTINHYLYLIVSQTLIDKHTHTHIHKHAHTYTHTHTY